MCLFKSIWKEPYMYNVHGTIDILDGCFKVNRWPIANEAMRRWPCLRTIFVHLQSLHYCASMNRKRSIYEEAQEVLHNASASRTPTKQIPVHYRLFTLIPRAHMTYRSQSWAELRFTFCLQIHSSQEITRKLFTSGDDSECLEGIKWQYEGPYT